MPSSASAINTTLTNYGQGYAQSQAGGLANFIAPVVATGIAQGQYKRFSDKNAFQVYESRRALGTGQTEISFGADDPYFNCSPHGLKITVDEFERQKAGAGANLLEQAKIRTLINAAVLSREYQVWVAAKAALTAVSGKGEWSNSSVDPIAQINEQIEAIGVETGMMPNRIVFGLGAWRVFCDHPKTIARQPGTDLVNMDPNRASRGMLNPAIEIRVGTMSRDTTKFGAAKSATNIVGGEVFIFYASDSPDQFDPSFMKTFSVDASMVEAVRTHRHPDDIGDVHTVDWTQDIVATATASARRITLS